MSLPEELKIVFESFDRNALVNKAVLATLKMDDLDYSDGVGGFSIGQHLADIVDFRPSWVTRVSPGHLEGYTSVTDEKSPTWLGVKSIDELQQAFDAGDTAMRQAVLDAVNEGRSFETVYQSHPANLIQHCIVHDSHHRGQIMALLRQAGRPVEQRERLEEATWPIWRE
ncbi:MAG TPA: DinB family protein [Trueperaceae bacterium]|nr:DinB family protein [Trueperaceae bacterium]